MKEILYCILIIPAMIMAQNSGQPKTVDYVDLKRYAGLWYEIARMPNRFQSDCAGGTTAHYSIMEDGKIKVINTCIQEDGEKDEAEGVAKVVDKKTNSKIEVSFFSFLGIRPFWGDYWIIGLDKDYQYAVIGHPERKYGWILCRKPKMTDAQINEAFGILKANGYNKESFNFTKQTIK